MKFTKTLFIILAFLASSVSSLSEQPVRVVFDTDFSSYELQKFGQHTERRLPLYIEEFKKYSELYEIPWTLLAAVAYQESKWDHNARSYTGVRGLMQITERTAEYIGIEDRRDPIENIRGGAYYLRYLFNKTSPELSNLQRWTQTLIAYNIGWSHLRDALRLSQKLNKNHKNWDEFKTVLPKLEDKNHYSNLSYGYARGNETIEFVENVFGYYNLISIAKTDSKDL